VRPASQTWFFPLCGVIGKKPQSTELYFLQSGCALTKHAEYSTPLGDLTVDLDITKELSLTGEFDWMSEGVDEDEHSIEMHLPYIVQVSSFRARDFESFKFLVWLLVFHRCCGDQHECYICMWCPSSGHERV